MNWPLSSTIFPEMFTPTSIRATARSRWIVATRTTCVVKAVCVSPHSGSGVGSSAVFQMAPSSCAKRIALRAVSSVAFAPSSRFQYSLFAASSVPASG